MTRSSLYKTLYNKAVQLLAQRNHTSAELKQKLSIYAKRIFKEDNDIIDTVYTEIDAVIQYCIDHRWLDNNAYIDQYIDMRSRKGYGRYRIIQELKQKGLDEELITSQLRKKEMDWVSLGLHQARKKFRSFDKKDLQQKMKLFQFLAYRGFSQDEIDEVFRSI